MNNILLKLYKIKSYLLLTLAIVSFVFNAESQNPAINQVAKDFNNLTENIHSDNVYIQTSKDIYETEEDLWFKAYVLDAQYLFPSKRSKILYVQLINDETKQAVWEEKYEIENGFVDGHLYIQDSLKTGRYSLSGYSEHSYFQNQEAFYALKKVTIVKNIKQKVETTSVKNDSIAQFALLPEGGHLVANIENTLAFKATDTEGLPVDFKGTLFENDLPILYFKSLHAGMGSFNFMPKSSKTYHIQLFGTDKKHQLPEIKDSGKVLRLISNTDDFLSFKVLQSESLKQETIFLRLQIKGVIYSIASAKLKDDILIKIPLKDMPQGIAEVTLFDSDLKPVAERLVYVKQDQKLNIKTVLNKSEYETREKAKLKIKVTDKNGKPVETHLGLSVYDKVYQDKSEQKNILTHYYLSTQLKGTVYNPAYYFDEANPNRLQALDVLLLTQGWRRYIWNETKLKTQGKQLQSIVFDTIKGEVLAKRKKDIKLNIPLFILAFNSNIESIKQVIEVDTTNNFVINPEHLKIGDKGYMYLKLITPEYSKYKIYLKDVAFNNINESKKNKSIFYPKSRIEILEDKESEPFIIPDELEKLDEIRIKAKRKTVFRDKYIGKLDSLVKLELSTIDYVCAEGNILNCPIHKRNSSSKRPVEGGIYQKLIIMENGNWVDATGPIPDGTRFNNPYIPAYRYPKLTDAYLMERYNIIRVKGYYGKREFYQPVYDEVSINDPFPDYRNTLYWKPDIITDENGEATVEFICSDINTFLIGNIEGVSQNGLLGNDGFEFKVVKRN